MVKPPFELYRLDRDLTRDQLIAALAESPTRFAAAVAGVAPAALERRLAPGGWSPIATLLHTRDVMQVYGMRFKWIILDDDPFLPNFDEDRWVANSPDGGAAALPDLLAEMRAYRNETIRLLRALSPEGWSRTGRHEVLGEVTLDSYVRHQLAHEEQHLAQLQQALA